ncbi:hypothetical protein ACFX2I_009883 [Malus domestica]
MTWLHTIPPLGSLKTCCPVMRAAPNQTPHPGSPEQNLDNIRSGGNDQIAYRKLCSCTNFADGSWDLSRLPCLSSDLDEVSVLQRGFQRRCKLVEGWMAKPIWKQADPRFVWNKNILDELIDFQTAELKLKNLSATLTIVSRRCTRRLGTRM